MPHTDDGVPRHDRKPLIIAGILTTTLVAAMAPSTAAAQENADGSVAAEASDNAYIDRFVQEGTPAPVGGRFIQLDPFIFEGPSYSMTKSLYPYSEEMSVPDGVFDTAFVVSARNAAVYRSDGSTEQFDQTGSWMPDVPAETGIVSMAANGHFGGVFVVTGDGRLRTNYWEWEQILPEDPQDLGYTAVAAGDDVFYAIRAGGGEIIGFAKPEAEPDLACQEHWSPAAGTGYTAISAAGRSWMALRSDGAVVTCGYGSDGVDRYVGEIHVAPSGSAYVGIDAGDFYGLAASSAGGVESFGATDLVPIEPPAGSRVVGLSAGTRTGAYILSDGSLTTWGESLQMPDFPTGTDRFVAVSEDSWGSTYAIWAHEVLDLSIEVTVPASVRIGQPVNARVEVTGEGEYRPDGRLCLVNTDGMSDPLCSFTVTDGTGTLSFDTEPDPWSSSGPPGTRQIGFGLVSALGGFTYTTVTFEVLPPAATELTATIPSGYPAGAEVSATFTLSVEDETVPDGDVVLRAIVGEDDDDLGFTDDDVVLGHAHIGSTDPVTVAIDSTALPDGQYAVKAKYLPTSSLGMYTPTAPAQWRGNLTVGVQPFAVSAAPSISGTAQVGKTLTATRGSWIPVPTTVKYQWRLDGTAVSGATSSTWTVPASAKGKKATVAVTGSKTGYTTRTVVSAATATVQAGVFVAPRPSISGTPQVGKTLTAMRGTWTPSPTTTRYQWRLDGRAVSGATSRTWNVPASARGKRVTVAVTGSKVGYATKTLVSPPTEAVRAGVFVAPRPTITGTASVGSTLRAVRGTWTPQPTTVRYQWKVGGVAVRGATSYLFQVPASARGKRIVVTVTGLRAGYTTRTVASYPTGVIR